MCLFTAILFIQVTAQVQGLFHLHSMITYNGPHNLTDTSLFGFSISSQSQSLYVSDPTANHIGQIYAIDINSSNLTNERVNATIPRYYTIKHDFFLGATIKSKLDTFTVACMPRYTERKILDYKTKIRNLATIGFCYLKTLDGEFNEMQVTSVPDRFKKWAVKSKEFVGIEKMDSFGWSVDITPENTVFVGGPAIDQGKLIIYTKPLDHLIHPTPIDNKKLSPREKVLYNLGYSVASGYFFERKISYAASTTFGDLGYGRVYFFDSKLNNVDVVTDTRFGAMFGAALCTLHLNGKNGLTALLVGAPAFSDFNRPNEYDIGVVYLYVAQNKRMKLKITIKGKKNGGYFGFAIINLGDMDGDSNDEIAIAAPYEDEGRGAIYIYTSSGILAAKYSQRLVGESWFPNFGYGITIVKDINDNGCNELAVSSPKNNKIIMLKSIPSITVTIRTEFPDLQGIAIEKVFQFKTCIDVIYPEKPTKIEAELVVSVEILANATLEAAAGKDAYIYTQTLKTRQSTYCSEPIETKLNAIEKKSHRIPYEITAKLKEDPLVLKHFDPSRVLLSERSNLILADVVWINDCGDRNCKPDLSLEINTTIPETYLIGSSDTENLSLTINNYGETAYEPCIIVTVPNAAIIKRPTGCTVRNVQEIKCTRSRPLRNNTRWEINDIIIETKQLTSRDETLVIKYDLYNKCSDKSSNVISNNTFKLISDASGITIKNVTNPEEFTVITMSDIELGKTVEHHYTISNEGKTNWVDVKSEITFNKIAYVKYYEISINVYTEKSWISCAKINSNEINEDLIFCDISELGVQKSGRVVISVIIPPNTLDLNDDNKNISIVSNINLLLKHEVKSSSLNTLLLLYKEKVPIWIIVMASIIGFVILSIIAILLYKCGFLHRKNKDELNRLKKDVHRQSVRRSIMRESMRVTANRRSTETVQFQQLTEPEHSEEYEIK